MVKISIIMPVFNGGEFLERSIRSIDEQTLNDIELICVDDGSTDNSLELLNQYSNDYKFIKVISQDNQGSGKARNTGISNATGDYIAFLDADDIFIDGDALEMMYKIAEINGADIVSANLQFVNRDYTLKENPHYGRGDYAYFDGEGEINPNDYGIPYAFYKNIFKKEFLDMHEIVFPDLLRGQDPVFLSKALGNTDVVYTCSRNLYGYNHSVGGGVNNKMNNYQKKKSYVQHFRDACDELARDGLVKISAEYKLHLTRYLNWKKNNKDEDLFRIYGIIFPDRYEYFTQDDENFTVFNTAAESYLLYYSDDEENFRIVKNHMKNTDESVLPKHVREKYDLIMSSDSLDEYKDSYYNDKIDRLEKRHKNLTDKIEELKKENAMLEEEAAGLESDVEKVKSSKSFKIAKKFKNILK